MFKPEQMNYYYPEETVNVGQKHTVLYTFQYEDAFAQFITEVNGNVMGGNVMETDFFSGMSARNDNELNQKHVIFSCEDVEGPYQEIDELRFIYPDGVRVDIQLNDCLNLLVGIQIINYEP